MSLLEVVFAFAVMSIVAAIAVPIFLSQDARAEQAVLEANLADAYSLLYTAGYEGGVALPSTLPAGVTTEIGDAGSFSPNYTLTVFGNSESTICVQGETPSGLQMMGDAGGVREGVCTPPFTYLDTAFTAGTNEEVLSPTLDNRLGDPVFSATPTGGVSVAAVGDGQDGLPPYVTFDSATGQFTGPPVAEWRFQGVEVSAGTAHTCVLTTVGTVKCWGDNRDGQLGTGSTSNGGSTVVDTTGLPAGDPVVHIAAGDSHTCAVTESGAAYCWGDNSDGQLGDGTTTASATPVQVSGYGSAVASIYAGGNTTCLVTDSGGLACFGNGAYGQLGNGANNDSSTAVTPNGLASGVQDVAVGETHVCAIVSGGGVTCFGSGNQGELGQGNNAGSNTPVTVQNLSNATDIAAGNNHTCAVVAGGDVKCWGLNGNGQLGDGNTSGSRNTPGSVAGVLSATSIIASGNHTCVTTGDGNLECWGGNANGQLGSLNAGGNRDTASIVTGTSNVANAATGKNHTCTILNDKSVQCWGSGARGQLGYDPTGKPGYTTVPSEPYCLGSAVLDTQTNECVTTTENPGFYTCPSGGTLSGTSCVTPVYVPPVTTYSCPSGGSLSGTTCYYNYTYYTCPSGATLSGTTCSTPYTYYTCPSGGTLSGTTCNVQTFNRWICDAQAATAAGLNVNEGLLNGPRTYNGVPNTCTWDVWLCAESSGWTKVDGSLCRRTLGPGTSSSTCSSLSSSLGTQLGYPVYASGYWTAAVSTTTYSCPSGWSRSGTTCSRTVTNTSSGNLGSTLCSSARSSLCPSGTWSCSNTSPRPWSCTTTTTQTQAATANTTTTPGYCTYYTNDYAYNATLTTRTGFAPRAEYTNSSYSATPNTGYTYSSATPVTGTASYAATANTTAGYWTTSSYGATWNPATTTVSRLPAPWTEAKEYLATPTQVLGSGEQPGFPAELTVMATYPNGTTHSETITLTIEYPLARQE